MSSSPIHILLIDDDPQVEGILVTSLHDINSTWHSARDGQSGLDIARQGLFDLILLDMGLPDLDGFEVLRNIRSHAPLAHVPVIVLTAWDSLTDKVKAFELGANDYITKPFALAELRARVKATLRTKFLQDELAESNRVLEAATRAKSEFLASMSHEIRTPMNGVVAMTSLLLDSELTSAQREYAETIRQSAESLLTIINDILDFSKVEARRMELECQPFDLRLCVEDVLDLFSSQATEKGLELICEIGPNLPSWVLGDVTRIRQVLANLVSNALKFTEKGELMVDLQGHKIDPHTLPANGAPINPNESGPSDDLWQFDFAVRDTGIGIPADKLDKLFQRFSQVDASTTRRYGGTGLGLIICKNLIEIMGGGINVDTAPDRGSTFSFHLPLRTAPAPPAPAWKGIQTQWSASRVLIVDDNDTSRRALCQQARLWGLRPQDTASSAQALQWLRQGERFKTAILDSQMPEMDGLALACQIRQLPNCRSLPIILLTQVGAKISPAAPGMDAIAASVNKPVKPAQLHEALAAILQGSAAVPAKSTPQFKLDHQLAQRFPLRLLLAEDNVINQKVAKHLFHQMGYRVDVAANGREAVQALARQPYDLVFMDLQMPEMDGLEATRRIRQAETEASPASPHAEPVVIVAMTANAMKGDRDACLSAGMNDYLSKPVRPESLQAIIEHWGPLVKKEPRDSSIPPSPDTSLPFTGREGEKAASTVIDEPKPSPSGQTPAIDSPSLSAQPEREPAFVLAPPVVVPTFMECTSGDLEGVHELADIYLKQTTAMVATLHEALRNNDIATVERVAHKCAGSSATCGMLPISHMFRNLEIQTHEAKLTPAQGAEFAMQIDRELERIREFLQNFDPPVLK